jgi:protein TonB
MTRRIAMQLSSYSKFTLVAGLHVLVGALLLQSMHMRKIAPSLPDPVLVVMQPEPPKVLPPPDPPKPMQELAPPTIAVPVPEVPVAPPVEPTVRAAYETEPAPQHPFTPMQSVPDTPPASNANANAGQIRTAVLADANSCALPDYPASAARNGESGITTLALLVGLDGRVSSARIEHSSGSRVLDRAALNALSLCRFKPATSNGAPEAGWAQLAYVWKLD